MGDEPGLGFVDFRARIHYNVLLAMSLTSDMVKSDLHSHRFRGLGNWNGAGSARRRGSCAVSTFPIGMKSPGVRGGSAQINFFLSGRQKQPIAVI